MAPMKEQNLAPLCQWCTHRTASAMYSLEFDIIGLILECLINCV